MTTLKYTYNQDAGGECDCCGSYYGESKRVFLDDEEVWHYETDGHFGCDQSDDSILLCVMNAWLIKRLNEHQKNCLEEARNNWNSDYP